MLPCALRSRRLLPLLRFHSSKSPDTLISLAEYVERMKEGQKHIYYLVGEAPPPRQSSDTLEVLLHCALFLSFLLTPHLL